jgi:hypothetical protein
MNEISDHIQGILQFKDYENSEFRKEEFNTNNLYKYGIFEEKSDIRAHVSERRIYVFKTNIVKTLLNNPLKKFKLVPAYQPNYDKPTAYGYLVPPVEIEDLIELNFKSWQGWNLFSANWNTARKGKWAVSCIVDLLKIGRFPLWVEVEQTEDVKLDIEGTDILICFNKKIQVKCDYPATKSGNLFLQTHEINPLKLH